MIDANELSPRTPEGIAPTAPTAPGEADAGLAITPDQAWAVVAALWTAYLLLVLLDVGNPGDVAVKALLMPSLLLWVVVALGRSAPAALVGGLALATLGDIGMSFEPPTMLVGIGGFLGMQVAYSAGFLRIGAWPAIRRTWPIPAAYLSFWAAGNLVLGPRLGELRVPVLVYSLALCTTAALAAGVDRRVALGGATFLLSDLLIGVRRAGLAFRHDRVAVMVTYLLSQYLIATGWARAARPDVAIPL